MATTTHSQVSHFELATTKNAKLLVVLGRCFFSLIFILASYNHFTGALVPMVEAKGVPFAAFAVPLSGLLAFIGGCCVLLGFNARFGAWLLILFLVPVTVIMHNFWTISDPQESQMQMVMFLKNLSMMGGALLITYFGAGPISFDQRNNK